MLQFCMIPSAISWLCLTMSYPISWGLPRWLSGKESACQCRRHQFDPWVWKIPWRRKWLSTPYSCLGNPMDRGAWWATVLGVAKSLPWLHKWAHILANHYLIFCQYFIKKDVLRISHEDNIHILFFFSGHRFRSRDRIPEQSFWFHIFWIL